jgi:hypothetical protein
MGPRLFLHEQLFCPSHRKIHWTTLVDNVGLETCLSGTSNSMITLTFFLSVNQSGPMNEFNILLGMFTYFNGIWDDFMVHGVNNP